MIDDGKGLLDIVDADPATFIRYHSGIQKILALKMKAQERPDLQVVLVVGQPGTGKTHWIRDQAGEDAFWLTAGARWFDGYAQQATVVFDDFLGWLQYGLLLRLCDKYPAQVEVRGASLPWQATRVYLSSNLLPEEWYDWSHCRGDRLAFPRRVTKFVVFTGYREYYETADYASFLEKARPVLHPAPQLVE